MCCWRRPNPYSLRPFTTVEECFSKKWESQWAAVAVWCRWYNFGRVHKSLRMTPAMAAGISANIWSVRDLLKYLTINVI
ncbi:MAG: hypothetical protein M3O20_05535 [Acidobacteriota bacterium]|nr:hypothetical protein [Acidobacteriota bacterium]